MQLTDQERAALVEELINDLVEAYYVNISPIRICDGITDDGDEINSRVVPWERLSLSQRATTRQRFWKDCAFTLHVFERYIDRLLAARPEPADDAVERHPMQDEVWSIIRRAMNTPHTDSYEKASAYKDAYASDAAKLVIAALAAAGPGDDLDAAGPGDDLDALLDGLHPRAKVQTYPGGPIGIPAEWYAVVRVPVDGHVGNRAYEGTGATRMQAIANAVAAAREATHDH